MLGSEMNGLDRLHIDLLGLGLFGLDASQFAFFFYCVLCVCVCLFDVLSICYICGKNPDPLM